MKKTMWSSRLKEKIEAPSEIVDFLVEYEELCRKHNISLAHEDTGGGFLLEKYSDHNLKWVKEAAENL